MGDRWGLKHSRTTERTTETHPLSAPGSQAVALQWRHLVGRQEQSWRPGPGWPADLVRLGRRALAGSGLGLGTGREVARVWRGACWVKEPSEGWSAEVMRAESAGANGTAGRSRRSRVEERRGFGEETGRREWGRGKGRGRCLWG